MPKHEFELAEGDSIRVGNRILTVIDIDGDDVSFRVETIDVLETEGVAGGFYERPRLPPR